MTSVVRHLVTFNFQVLFFFFFFFSRELNINAETYFYPNNSIIAQEAALFSYSAFTILLIFFNTNQKIGFETTKMVFHKALFNH